jgi:hypothetical protein
MTVTLRTRFALCVTKALWKGAYQKKIQAIKFNVASSTKFNRNMKARTSDSDSGGNEVFYYLRYNVTLNVLRLM